MSIKTCLLKSILIIITLLTLTSCNSSTSVSLLKFSFNTQVAANSADEKSIYINDDLDKLELNAKLEMDSGDVSVQVIRSATGELVWSESYKENSNFIIELSNLKSGSEYVIKIEASQSKNVTLEITSSHKLVQDKETPEKYRIEKQ